MLAFGRFSDIPLGDKLFAGASSVCVCSFSVCVCCLQAVQQLARHDHVTTPVMADGPLQCRHLVSPLMLHDVEIVWWQIV